MNTYNPDYWVIVQIDENKKVLAGWVGGYLDGDSWRMSSGITDIKVRGDDVTITNRSGSVYQCKKSGYGFTGLMGQVYQGMQKTAIEEGIELSVMDVEDLR